MNKTIRSLFPVVTICLIVHAVFCSTPSPVLTAGHWIGSIAVPGGSLTIVFNISQQGEKRTATCDSPDQGVTGITVESVEAADGKVIIALPSIGSRFEGILSPDGRTITGKWQQGGMEMDCEVRHSETPYTVNRPQNPKSPLPYTVSDITFPNPDAGITLAGTLTIPEGSGPFPAMVLVAGSGPNDRDETVFNHKPFLVLADHLTRTGIAVLRFDKRGIGGSGGDYQSATTDDFASDAMAAVTALESMNHIRKDRIGVLGHSEGALVAPMLAAHHPERIDCLVLIGAPGVPGRELMPMQMKTLLERSGTGKEQVREALEQQSALFGIVLGESDPAKADTLLDQEMKRRYALLSEEERSMPGMTEQEMIISARVVNSKWFRRFLTLDPRDYLKQTRCPVLALWGERDLQVVPKQNLPEVEKALRKAGNPEVILRKLPEFNHLFQTAETGLVSEYPVIEETMAPVAMKTISDWLWEHWSDTRKE